MLPIRPTSQFRKDLKKAKKQRRNLKALSRVLEQLAGSEPLAFLNNVAEGYSVK